MANALDFTGVGTGTTNDTSPVFEPKTTFMLLVTGTIASNIEFTIEYLPNDLPDTTSTWYTADGTVTLNSTSHTATVNFPKGFQCRVKRSGTGNQTDELGFYWGHVSTIDFAFG